jgi:hypothetical protein
MLHTTARSSAASNAAARVRVSDERRDRWDAILDQAGTRLPAKEYSLLYQKMSGWRDRREVPRTRSFLP